ncbi:MAG: hypothetical protein Q4E53_13015 [Eubacteriales bacterium]|nr:hypothetical protein [Eubacteriales bacterium]
MPTGGCAGKTSQGWREWADRMAGKVEDVNQDDTYDSDDDYDPEEGYYSD